MSETLMPDPASAPSPSRTCRPFLTQEIDLILRDYPTAGAAALAARLGRHPDTIAQKAAALGLRFDRPRGLARRRILAACGRDADRHGGICCPERVAKTLGIGRDHVRKAIREAEAAMDATDEPDPTPEELAGIAARWAKERRAKIRAEEKARTLALESGDATGDRPGWTVPRGRLGVEADWEADERLV